MIFPCAKKSRIFLLCFVFFFSVSAASESGFEVLERSSNGMVVQWTAPKLDWQHIAVEQKSWALPRLGDLPTLRRSGWPQLPVAVFAPLLPEGKTAVVVVVDSVVEKLDCPRIAPAPSLDIDKANTVYREEGVYQQAGYYPRNRIEYDHACGRDRHHHRVALYPLLYNPVLGRIRVLHYIRFALEFRSPTRLDVGNASFDKRPDVSPQSALQPAAPGIKLMIADSGVYQISGSDLVSLGVDISAIDITSVQLFCDGREQPLFLTSEAASLLPEDKIRFFGRGRRGNATYYHMLSDTNVYRLLWGNRSGKRFEPAQAAADSSLLQNRVYVKKHFEQDHYYYEGDSDSDIEESDKVPGEGWVWRFINRGSSYAYTFSLPHLYPHQDSARIQCRLRGTTLSPLSPDHHVQISLNNALLSDFTFDDRQDTVVTLLVSNTLQAGDNQLIIRSLSDIDGARSQFYLDWIDLFYDRSTGAEQGMFSFTGSAANWFVDGFLSSDVFAWDLNNALFYPLAGDKQSLKWIEVNSAGYSDGNHAIFNIDDQNLYNGKRGHNLVLLHPQTGAVLDIRSFDTWKSSQNADSLARFLDSIHPETIVLAAIRDEGSKNLNAAVYNAYESIGSQYIRQVKDRDSWCIIGIKGAVPGSVFEVHQPALQGPAVCTQQRRFYDSDEDFAVVFKPQQAGHFVVFDTTSLKQPDRLAIDRESDLKSNRAQCDYILLTHPLFSAAAERLAAYRRNHDTLSVRIVMIDDVYDEFNHGLADIEAIKDFLKFARANWQPPSPRFLAILGDASWDPKNLSGPQSRMNYVPAYGNPVSDVWFTLLDGDDDLIPDLSVGRIPAQTPQQAEAFVDKVIEYENTPAARWKKNFCFITGGFNRIEQTAFMQQSMQLDQEYINAAPVYGSSVMINKESQGYVEGEHRQDILDAINKGTIWLNFTGHSGSRTWDLMFHDPDVYELNNAPKYPFISSMTCHTGRYAEPLQESFGEVFLHAPQKGAVAFMGTSGWGYSDEDHLFMERLYPLVLQDTVRVLSEAITRAKIDMWQQFGSTRHVRNLILQYTLLGDPAMRLQLPTRPDPALQPGALSFDPEVVSEADSFVTVTVAVDNFGLMLPDSLEIRLEIKHEKSGLEQLLQRLHPPVQRSDTLSFRIPLRNRVGANELTVVLDPKNRIAESDENNNRLVQRLYVLSNRLRLLSPFRDNMLAANDVELRILNPQTPDSIQRFFEFEIDTTIAFTSPFLQRSGPIAGNGLITVWTPSSLQPDQLYFWRVRDSGHRDKVSWSQSAFYTTASSGFGWYQQDARQFAANDCKNVAIDQNGVSLQREKIELYVESAGFTDGNYARLLVGENSLVEPSRGHNTAVINAATGLVESIQAFDTYQDSSAANDMAAMIEALPDSHYVLLAIRDDGSRMMTERAYAALESLGSLYCRRVGMRDSWAMIGRKNADPGSLPEVWHPSGNGSAVARDTLFLFKADGLMKSYKIGPSHGWKRLTWKADIPSTCSASCLVLAPSPNSSKPDTLARSRDFSRALDLTAISPDLYPYLSFHIHLKTKDRRLSPLFYGWQCEFEPAPDLAVAADGLTAEPDSVIGGETVAVRLLVNNIGQAAADRFDVGFSYQSPKNERHTFAVKSIDRGLQRDDTLAVSAEWQTPPSSGIYKLSAEIDAGQRQAELYEDNNMAVKGVRVMADTVQPSVELFFDGREILDGDWVSPRPHIQIKIFDNNNATCSDSADIDVFLDQQRIPFSGLNHLSLTPPTSVNMNALVEYRPELSPVDHHLNVLVKDRGGNNMDMGIGFRVTHELQLLDLMNYPNPVAEETDFSFILTQSAAVQIKIYTVAGNLLRLVNGGQCSVGFNHIHWNGRDQEGDHLANGVYLYKAIARGENDNAENVGRLLIMR